MNKKRTERKEMKKKENGRNDHTKIGIDVPPKLCVTKKVI